MPPDPRVFYDGYYKTSPECWSVFTEVMAAEFENAVLFGQLHQLTVDAYAVQHAGGDHPAKSVAIHLSGLYLVFERGLRAWQVAPLLQNIARQTSLWPQFRLPPKRSPTTILSVAMACDGLAHAERARDWARQVWRDWDMYIEDLAALCKVIPLEAVND